MAAKAEPGNARELVLAHTPVLWHQYVRGAVLGAKRFPAGGFAPRIPAAAARVSGIEIDPDHLHAYRRLCGFPDAPTLPPTYPYVLATPLAAAMLVRSEFPYPLLGVVHVRQQITQHEPIAPTASLSLRTWFGDEREVARGIEFETHFEIEHGGACVWEGTSVALVRDPAKNGRKSRRQSQGKPRESTARGLESTRFVVPADLGRRYAALTQDYNPIHLWPLTARLFGYARPIVHGMWSLARGLAEHQGRIPRRPFRLDCEFRKPVMLPCEVRLFGYEDETGFGFSLRDQSGEKKHLECTVRPLESVAEGSA